MAEGERETVVVTGGPGRGATALAAVIAFVLLLILLAYAYGGELYGGASGGDSTGVKVNIQPLAR